MTVSASGEGLLDILNAVAELSNVDVLVGVPHGEARTDGDGLTNAQIGYILETGSPAMNLPPRPHLARGVEEVQDDVADRLTKAVDAALQGNTKRMYLNLGAAGKKAVMSVKAVINSGDFEELAPATIKARKSRKRKSKKPLVDTAQYRNSHTYVVLKNSEEIQHG